MNSIVILSHGVAPFSFSEIEQDLLLQIHVA